MAWLIIITGSLIAVIASGFFYYFIVTHKISKKIARWLTLACIIVGSFLMQFYGAPHYLAYNFESKIKNEDPIFVLLAKNAPLEFNAYLAKIKSSFLKNEADNIPYYTGEYIYSQLIKYSPHANNQSFYELAKATVALYNKIYPRDPNLVLIIEFNLQTPPHPDFSMLDKTYNQAFDPVSNAKKMIIESAIQDPQPALSENDKERALSIIQDIMTKLSLNYGNELVFTTFNHPNNPLLNQKIAAEIIIAFYQMILDHGKDDAGLVIKYIFSTAGL